MLFSYLCIFFFFFLYILLFSKNIFFLIFYSVIFFFYIIFILLIFLYTIVLFYIFFLFLFSFLFSHLFHFAKFLSMNILFLLLMEKIKICGNWKDKWNLFWYRAECMQEKIRNCHMAPRMQDYKWRCRWQPVTKVQGYNKEIRTNTLK